jgi:hypothetical protein
MIIKLRVFVLNAAYCLCAFSFFLIWPLIALAEDNVFNVVATDLSTLRPATVTYVAPSLPPYTGYSSEGEAFAAELSTYLRERFFLCGQRELAFDPKAEFKTTKYKSYFGSPVRYTRAYEGHVRVETFAHPGCPAPGAFFVAINGNVELRLHCPTGYGFWERAFDGGPVMCAPFGVVDKCPCPSIGNPVGPGTGSKLIRETDYSSSGSVMPLSLERA